MDWYLTAVKLLMTGYRQTSRATERSIMPRIIFVFLLIRKMGGRFLNLPP